MMSKPSAKGLGPTFVTRRFRRVDNRVLGLPTQSTTHADAVGLPDATRPPPMSDFRQPDRLRVLIADGRQQRLQHVTGVIESLGHTVIAEATDIGLVALLTSENLPDVAVVCVDESSEQALHLIRQIVKESSCPVIALLDVEDADFVNRAAQIGVFAYIVSANPEQLQSAFGIALRRFAEYHGLEGAFYRRAITERAKGILMERHRDR